MKESLGHRQTHRENPLSCEGRDWGKAFASQGGPTAGQETTRSKERGREQRLPHSLRRNLPNSWSSLPASGLGQSVPAVCTAWPVPMALTMGAWGTHTGEMVPQRGDFCRILAEWGTVRPGEGGTEKELEGLEEMWDPLLVWVVTRPGSRAALSHVELTSHIFRWGWWCCFSSWQSAWERNTRQMCLGAPSSAPESALW